MKVLAILETMWDWRGMTTGAGYVEAPSYFRINPENYTGKRLYRLVGDAPLLVTNACRELGNGPNFHGKGNPEWLGRNLVIINEFFKWTVLLVCGGVAQKTFQRCGYVKPPHVRVLNIPHPAARYGIWTTERIVSVAADIRSQ